MWCAAAALAADQLEGFDCLIEPYSLAEVSTKERGVLQALLVERGDLVTTGQLLGYLNRDVEEATVALASAQAESSAEIDELRETLAFAVRERERIDQLSDAKAISLTEKDRASTEAIRAEMRLRQALERQAIARLELERARRLLENRAVHSPVDGIVMARLMAPGEAAENRPIVRVAQVNPLNVEIIVPVDAFGAIEVGMQAEVTPRYPGANVEIATVTVVDQVVDAASDTFGVRLMLPNPDYRIPGGVRCSIRFLADTLIGTSLPASAPGG